MSDHDSASREAPQPEAPPSASPPNAPASAPPSTPAAPPAPPPENPASLEEQYRSMSASFRRSRHRPLAGPALVTFGVLLWAYVAFGHLVLAFGFPEGLAVLTVLGTFAVATYTSGRQSVALLRPLPGTERVRFALPGLLGAGLVLATVLLVTAFAMTQLVQDAPITLFLLALAFAAATYGYHVSGPNLNPPPPALKVVLLGARVLGALLSIAVVASALIGWR